MLLFSSINLLLNVLASNHFLVRTLDFSVHKKRREPSCLFAFNFFLCLAVLAKISNTILSGDGFFLSHALA